MQYFLKVVSPPVGSVMSIRGPERDSSRSSFVDGAVADHVTLFQVGTAPSSFAHNLRDKNLYKSCMTGENQ